jgi:ribosome-binding protein aMBF1 (putative translation factor)
VQKRLSVLQTGQPFPLQVLASLPVESDLQRIERTIHHFLETERQRGEWFTVEMDQERLEALILRAIQYLADAEPRTTKAQSEEEDYGLGPRVKIPREWAGLTQPELARRSGVHAMAISRLERGEKKDVTGATLRKLSLALGVSTDWLLDLADHDTPTPTPPKRPRPRKTAPVG